MFRGLGPSLEALTLGGTVCFIPRRRMVSRPPDRRDLGANCPFTFDQVRPPAKW